MRDSSSTLPESLALIRTHVTTATRGVRIALSCDPGSALLESLNAQQPPSAVRDVLYGVYCGGTKPGIRSVRRGEWKLVKFDALDGSVRETQLFHLGDNPDEFLGQHHDAAVVALTGAQPAPEQRNLAGDVRYAEVLAEMEALLLSEMERLDDPDRLWNQ